MDKIKKKEIDNYTYVNIGSFQGRYNNTFICIQSVII